MTASEKLSAFIHKLPVSKMRVENCNFVSFPNLDSISVDNQDEPLVNQIYTHLGWIRRNIYFQLWIQLWMGIWPMMN